MFGLKIKSKKSAERKILEEAFARYRGGLDAILCKKILDRIEANLGTPIEIGWADEVSSKSELLSLGFRVVNVVRASVAKERRLRSAYDIFSTRIPLANTRIEKQELMLDMLYEIEQDKNRLAEYHDALDKWLDIGLVIERYKLSLHIEARFQEKGLTLAGILLTDFIEEGLKEGIKRLDVAQLILAENGFENFINDRIKNGHSWLPRVAGLRIYNRFIRALPEEDRSLLLSPKSITIATRLSHDTKEDLWVQREAMRLLANTYPSDALSIFEFYIRNPKTTDDHLFIRASIVRFIGDRFPDERGLPLIDLILEGIDPSEYVRVETMRVLARFPFKLAFPRLANYIGESTDTCEQVRAAAIESLGVHGRAAIDRGDSFAVDVVEKLAEAIRRDSSLLVRRIALEELTSIATKELASTKRMTPVGEVALCLITSCIENPNETLFFRRLAWRSYEEILLALSTEIERVSKIVKDRVLTLFEGERARISLEEMNGCSIETFARLLANYATDDFGYFIEIEKGAIVVQRGERWGVSLWRILHEIRRPAPDKRKGASHIIGRKPFGTIRVPSQLLAELTKTRVPGEPVFIEIEGGWRPFVPLLTDFLDVLLKKRSVKFFTSLGITTLECKLGTFERLKSYLRLSWNFEQVADLRNVGLDGRNPEGPVEYLRTLKREYGIDCSYKPYSSPQISSNRVIHDPSLDRLFFSEHVEYSPSNETITSYFSFAIPFLAGGEPLFDRLRAYIEDLSENTVTQLWIYFLLGFSIFLARQYWIFYKIRKALSSLPLIIGGWGTRGKSGTERKKAALFHALGYDIFSKTTGCEAMFLHSTSEKRPAEIFLYRPYDKASIWEMGSTAKLAASLGVEVYLWECMALNPRFVRLLQKGWMKDHLSTITNTYPDHEDVQGPAGIDIPRVMTEFLPPGRPAFTSEDQMLPILRDAARRQRTELFEVSWRESAMLTKDILDRFPYKVHPRNLALVLKIAEYFSIDKDFALKGIADHIVPDLGVLKTYPVANVEGRRLEFSNGMSANERRGFIDS